MLDNDQTADTSQADYVEFLSAGTSVVGAYHCAQCGYGVTLRSALPVCPMCSGKTWEQAPWSPFGRTQAEQVEQLQ